MCIKTSKGGNIKELEIAKQCARLARDKKAIDTIILEVKELTDIASYFVVCHGISSTQIKTIADYIVEKLAKKGELPLHVERDKENKWIVIDFVNVMVHIFDSESRDYYRLERLWGDARVVKFRRSPKTGQTAKKKT